jgi:LysR family transcriptional activator of nhaA
MKVFGEQGEGVFPGPSVIEKEIRDHYGVIVVGRTEDIRERYYAITVERRIKHPVVQAISDAARARLFGPA